MKKRVFTVLMAGLLAGLLSACVSWAETPGERFRKALKEIEAACAKRKLDPGEVCGGVAKLKPADPLATEEGRFAHSIKIPNPVPEDSGYKPGMTQEQYFEHLCNTEAGEFLYKTVDNVEGLYMMRPRKKATDDELSHLYALEDPYGYENWEAIEPGTGFVHPNRFKFIEMPITDRREPPWREQYVDHSVIAASPPGMKTQRYFGYDGRILKTLEKEYAVNSQSRYGYTWRGITRPHDRALGIAGSELIVLDLQTKEVLAVRRAYIRSGDVRKNLTGVWWMGGHVCSINSTRLYRTYEFIAHVLKPGHSQSKEVSDAAK